MKPEPSIQDAIDAIHVLFTPRDSEVNALQAKAEILYPSLVRKVGQVVELRFFGARGLTSPKKFVMRGYYDNFDRLAEDVIRASRIPGVEGVYWTLQEIDPALLARSPNQFREASKPATADENVKSYRWIPIDIDPVRPSGVSATDAEKQSALEVLNNVVKFFGELGCELVTADSGNGYHALLPVSLPVEDKSLVAQVIEALDERFSTELAKIDRTVFNPSRIFKGYGSIACKGADTLDRPHRAARLLHVPQAPPVRIKRELLEKIAASASPAQEKKNGKKTGAEDREKSAAKMEAFLAEGKVAHGPRVEYKDGFKWLLDVCPFNPEHRTPSIIVTVAGNGALGFRCMHNSCFDRHWEHFREHCEEKIGHKFEFTERSGIYDDAIPTNPRHLREMIQRSEEVLMGLGLKYFERDGVLVNTSYARDVTSEKGIERDGSSVIVQPASSETILRDLDANATYVRQAGIKTIVVQVPKNLPDQIHDRVRSESRTVPFPSLDLVTASPVLLPSGRVHQLVMQSDFAPPRGSVFEEGVMFVGVGDGKFPRIEMSPSHSDAVAALHQFDEIYSAFPFVDPERPDLAWNLTASYSVALSGILSLVSRPFLGLASIPIISASAPMRRTGKTKIIEAACMAALGYKATCVHFTDEEELGKHLLPLMQAGDRAILIDNIERTLLSSKLCILLTGGVMRDRILGKSENVSVKNYSAIFATGNNLIIGGDLSARAVRCDINPNVERPEARAFKFDPVQRAKEKHPQLVTAALTILRAYLLAGSPWTVKRQAWGGFEKWDRLVSGALMWVGCADPYQARERIISDDPIHMANADLLEVWYLRYKEQIVSFADIRRDRGEVYDALLKNGQWDGHHAQWVLRKLEGQTIDGKRLVRAGGRSQFRMVTGSKQGDLPLSSGPDPGKTPKHEDGLPF